MIQMNRKKKKIIDHRTSTRFRSASTTKPSPKEVAGPDRGCPTADYSLCSSARAISDASPGSDDGGRPCRQMLAPPRGHQLLHDPFGDSCQMCHICLSSPSMN